MKALVVKTLVVKAPSLIIIMKIIIVFHKVGMFKVVKKIMCQCNTVLHQQLWKLFLCTST